MSDLRIEVMSIHEVLDPIDERGEDFSIISDGEESGKLLFTTGAPGCITIDAEKGMPDLFKAHFERPLPCVELTGSTVVVAYPRFPLAHLFRRGSGDITLNGSIPWTLQFDGGVSNLTADLNRVALKGMVIEGGACRLHATLPRPNGSVRIRIGGGASNIQLMRPIGVPCRIRIAQGAVDIDLDDQHFRAIGGETRWETPDFKSSIDRYDITISGGARKLIVDTY